MSAPPTVDVYFLLVADDALLAAFGRLRYAIESSPGPVTPVLHVPAGQGRTHKMRLGVGVEPHHLMARLPAGVICVLDPRP